MRRIAIYLLTIFLAITLNFALPRLMPGDPLALIVGEAVRQMNPEQIAALRAEYGLNQPLWLQYGVYMGRLAQGDLGQSYRYSGGQPVTAILINRLAWTFFLVFVSLTLATGIGASLGAWSAWRRRSAVDAGLVAVLFVLRATPSFWLAMVLIPILAVNLRWLPAGDSYSFPRPGGLAGVVDVARHAILPVLVLTLAYLPVAFATMRAAMLTILNADYIRTARAKGLEQRRVLFGHAARNAMLPMITAFALDFGQMLGGVTLIETVFNYRGMGAMMFEAVKSRDYPLVQGGFLIFTLGVLGMNLLSEWAYRRFDPRLRSPV
jgi:peptide/nickel transport system permease protein